MTLLWFHAFTLCYTTCMSDSGRERRLDPRIANDLIQVELIAPSPQVRDLSITGLYLKDPRPLQRGQPVELRLRLGDADPIFIQGMVRRVDPGEGMGIEFIHVDALGRRRIKEFVSRINPERVSPAGEDIFK